jgi:hypothetical protein
MDRDEVHKLLTGGREGIAEWNRMRETREEIPDVRGADLREANLRGANLREAELYEANLYGADLREADFHGANLTGAILRGAKLHGANLTGAILIQANLFGAGLIEANLSGANLTAANLMEANLNGANLIATNLTEASCLTTVFANVDLSEVKGLDSVEHSGRSTVGIDTLFRFKGKIPETFLRGCGVPESLIKYLPSLIGSMEPIQFYSCFISYSSPNRDFAERLHADLQAKGVRCWFAPHDLKIGDRFRIRIDESIRVHDKLLVVLSESSVASQEVEAEVEAAMDREKSHGVTVLFPIRLDDAVIMAPSGWPALVRRSRNIGDFTGWKDHDKYQAAFARLLRDLKADASTGSGATAPETPR